MTHCRRTRFLSSVVEVVGLAQASLTLLAAVLAGSCSDPGSSPTGPESPTSPTVSRVEVTAQRDSILVGEAEQFTARVLDQVGGVLTGMTVTWKSGDEGVATVSGGGMATGVGEGSTVITATAEGHSGSASLAVTPVPVGTVNVTVDSVSVRVGQADSLPVVLLDRNGVPVTRSVTWVSSDTAVVKAYARGWIEGRGTGRAYVTAEVDDVRDSALVDVTATPGLDAADSASLTAHLTTLSSGWVQSSVDGANAVLTKASYGSARWESFFRGYFATHPFTDDLKEYLGYPVFFWFGADVRSTLQTALLPVLTDRVRAVALENGSDLQGALNRDPPLGETLSNSAFFLREYAERGLLAGAGEQLEPVWTDLMGAQSDLFFGRVSQNRTIRRLSAAVLTGLYEARPRTAARKAEVGRILRLGTWQQRLVDDFDVLVIPRWAIYRDDGSVESGTLTEPQMSSLHQHLSLMPGIADLRYVVPEDAWGLYPGFYHCCFKTRLFGSALVSLAARDIQDGGRENTFPQDVQPRTIPVFISVWIHEYHHVVDDVLDGQAWYRTRKAELIAQAGADSLNYLRSMIGSGFFQQYPVEFLASASQMYVVDSEHTLQLAIHRFDIGRPEPLNQLLFLAEVFARGGGETWFYVTGEDGGLTRQTVPLTRDASGQIRSLTVGGVTYVFDRDAKGNVLGVSSG